MILRRITQHVKAQNWFAVGLDFLIVVIGVFIGLQVSNWNDARQELAREQRLLGYLADDLRSDLDVIDNAITSAALRVSALDAVIMEATGAPLPEKTFIPGRHISVVKVAPYANEDPYAIGSALVITGLFDGNRSAYETIVNTGSIELIRNEKLALQIQRYYSHVDQRGRFEGRLMVFRDNLVAEQQAAGFSWVDELTVSEIAGKVRDNPQLLSAMKSYWSFSVAHRDLLRRSHGDAATLISEIEKETGQ